MKFVTLSLIAHWYLKNVVAKTEYNSMRKLFIENLVQTRETYNEPPRI
jgi:hypothetical protein